MSVTNDIGSAYPDAQVMCLRGRGHPLSLLQHLARLRVVLQPQGLQ